MMGLLAHTGEAVALNTVWQLWHFAHPLTLLLVIAAAWYQRGMLRLWQRAGYGRGIRPRQAGMFYAALITLFVALQSPLETLAGISFAAHMLQHTLLLFIVAPLLVLSSAPVAFFSGLPRHTAQQLARNFNRLRWLKYLWHSLTQLPIAAVVSIGTFWLWHHPALYELALVSEAVHISEHGLFLFTAVVFWWAVLQPTRQKIQYGLNVLVLFIAMLQGTLLGVLIVFSREAWYDSYRLSGATHQFDALQDQQFAGAIMWLPGGFIYTLLAAYYIVQWLNQIEAATQLVEMRRRQHV